MKNYSKYRRQVEQLAGDLQRIPRPTFGYGYWKNPDRSIFPTEKEALSQAATNLLPFEWEWEVRESAQGTPYLHIFGEDDEEIIES